MTTSETTVRVLGLPDLPRIDEIARSSFPRAPDRERLRRGLDGRDGLACNLGLERDGRLEAFALTWLVAGEVEVHDLAVAPEVRRRGLGAELLRAVLAGARERHVRIVRLEVESTNLAAIGLYQGAGFRETGRRAGYYGPGRGDAILMERSP